MTTLHLAREGECHAGEMSIGQAVAEATRPESQPEEGSVPGSTKTRHHRLLRDSPRGGNLLLDIKPVTQLSLRLALVFLATLSLLSALLFLARLEQVQRRYRRGVETQDAERARIARDIHDTLLQGVQALLFRLQMWEEAAQVPESLRNEMAAVIGQTKAIVLEARERILKMRRIVSPPSELAASLAAINAEVSNGKTVQLEVTVGGEAKSVSADVQEQLLEIAREAVRNAYQHAEATRIVVHLEYGKKALQMSIADDGRGVDLSILEGRGESIHFGLRGMHERASQVGARFRIHSSRRSGTRVEVTVPASSAFRNAAKSQRAAV